MATSKGSSLVDVDTRGVREEVLVDIEGNLNGSVGHDLGLDGSDGGANSVGRGSVVVLEGSGTSASGTGGARLLDEAVSGDTATRGVGVARVSNNTKQPA